MNFPNNQYHIAFLALGSNTPLSNLSSAEIVSAALDAILSNGITITLKSNWWQSPAFPTGSGADYINGVVAICTHFSPYELLHILHNVEQKLGRIRTEHRWGARTCDIDLLSYNDCIAPDKKTIRAWIDDPMRNDTPDCLMLPHPRIQNRAFVLAPLVEIAPKWQHPILKKTASTLLKELPQESMDGMQKLKIKP